MMRPRGFTLVELIVTITIMLILSAIVVVRLTSTQANGRDYERRTDIETIATGLETYYSNGSADKVVPKGYYPGSLQVQAAAAASPPYMNFLEGVSKVSYEDPGKGAGSFGFNSSAAASNPDGSYTDAQARTLLATSPYLYQPLKRDNTFCTNYSDCVKFNLYYLTEVDDTVHIVRSKHQ